MVVATKKNIPGKIYAKVSFSRTTVQTERVLRGKRINVSRESRRITRESKQELSRALYLRRSRGAVMQKAAKQTTPLTIPALYHTEIKFKGEIKHKCFYNKKCIISSAGVSADHGWSEKLVWKKLTFTATQR